jgi:ribosomal protein S18 acetylase RimI-like enzyme
MGVHHGHRGHGYGRAISLAAAAALREMGSSSAIVCTPTSYEGAIATYEAAGFLRLPQRWDLHREVTPDPAGPRLNP